jgi:hypothetical protein
VNGRHRLGGETRKSASCRTSFFLPPGIVVELAEQDIAIFLGPVGQIGDKAFDLFAGGFAEGQALCLSARAELLH